MNKYGSRLDSKTLWSEILLRSQQALRSGALVSIHTREETIEQGGVRFVARIVSSLAHKDQDRQQQVARSDTNTLAGNPFLPHDPDLFVADISDTHLCLLNKFNVIDHHVLIVTRRFEHQETLLNHDDFEALWVCMAAFDALGFYNGGAVAGASQLHKHLQMVPLPLSREGNAIPMATLLATKPEIKNGIGLPFVHAVTRLDPSLVMRPADAASASHERYVAMLEHVGITTIPGTNGPMQSMPYNLLIARGWMLLIPRSREHFSTISVNALGFAGSFFLHNTGELDTIRRVRPMNVLRQVAVAEP